MVAFAWGWNLAWQWKCVDRKVEENLAGSELLHGVEERGDTPRKVMNPESIVASERCEAVNGKT